MRFWVDAWDPAYGTSPDQDPLGASQADTDPAVPSAGVREGVAA